MSLKDNPSGEPRGVPSPESKQMGLFGALERYFETWSRRYVEMRLEAVNTEAN